MALRQRTEETANRHREASRSAASAALPIGVYIASRLIVIATFAVAAGSSGYSLRTALHRWDGEWYTWVARYGYFAHPHGAPRVDVRAFFPLYPAVVHGLSSVSGLSIAVSAVVVSGVAGVVAAWLLWVLALRVTDSQTALRAVALFAFFPGSFALSMAYAEPLFLAFAIGCVLLLLRRQWLWAGVLALLAGATRPDGAVLVVVTVYAAVNAIRSSSSRGNRGRNSTPISSGAQQVGVGVGVGERLRPVVAPVLVPVLACAGTLGFFGYLWARTGDPFIWFKVQRSNWHNYFDFGSAQIVRVLGLVRHALHPMHDPEYLVTTLALAFAAAGLVALIRYRHRLPTILTLYAFVSVGLSFTSHQVGTRPRAILLAFPLFIAVAIGLRGRWFALVLAVSAVLLAALSWVTATPGTLTP